MKPLKGADEPVIRYLTPAESTRLVNAYPTPFRQLVAGALHTGPSLFRGSFAHRG